MALSVKTREHIRRWAALAGPKWGALLGGAAALAAAIAFTGSALHFTTVVDTHGDTVRILTAATDLAAVLQQSGTPPMGEHDEAVWSQTEDGERLDVLRAYTVPVTADSESFSSREAMPMSQVPSVAMLTPVVESDCWTSISALGFRAR